jgi:diguanylate cyclase (GGDEF)-like protein
VVLERLGHRAELAEVLVALVDLVVAQFSLEHAWMIHDAAGAATVVGSTTGPPIADVGSSLRAMRESGPHAAVDHDDTRWIVPILSSTGESLFGAFVMPNPRIGGPNPYDLHVLARTVGLASLAFTRAEDDRLLQRAATTDHLTGVLNRRAFELRLAQTALRDDHYPVAAFFVDLDGFKSINDTYGHHVGDEVLTAIAGRLQTAVRSCDSVGRLGGDEFAVLCPDLEMAEIDRMTRRLQAVFADPVEVSGHRLGVTSAIGVASTQDEGGLEHLLRLADADMYRHKHCDVSDLQR